MNKLTVIVGVGVDKGGDIISPEEAEIITDIARHELLRIAGGVTVTRGEGSWINSLGELVTEPVVKLETAGPFTRKQALAAATRIRRLARQECVTFEFARRVDFSLV